MGPQSAPSTSAIYAPANAQIQQTSNAAQGLAAATPPQTYQYDPYSTNQNAALLSRAQILQNQQALALRSPEAAAGQAQAISTISGGEAGDDQILANQALKSGLEKASQAGTNGAGAITSATSRGGVTAANVLGSQLLNYRQQRAQQQLGLASSLQPDAAVSPGDSLSNMQQSAEGQISNQNNFNSFLSNQRSGAIQNLQNSTQQQEAAGQSAINANQQAANAGAGSTNGIIGGVVAAAAAAAVML